MRRAPAFLMVAPIAAAATSHTVRAFSLFSVDTLTWLWVLGLSIGGWFMAAGETLAGWVDGEKDGLLKNRLRILRLFALSIGAGIVAFSLGQITGMPSIVNEISVLLASYGGEQYLRTRMNAQMPAPNNNKGV